MEIIEFSYSSQNKLVNDFLKRCKYLHLAEDENFTECNFIGYMPRPLIFSSWQIKDGVISYPLRSWNCYSSGDICGNFITDEIGEIILISKFAEGKIHHTNGSIFYTTVSFAAKDVLKNINK